MNQFMEACQLAKENWIQCEALHNVRMNYISRFERKRNEKNINKKIDELAILMPAMSDDTQTDWMHDLDGMVKDWLKNDGVWNLNWLSVNEQDSFLSITKQFMRDARSFDDTISLGDIGQAMRNVWIFVILQKIFKKPLHYHKAIFAYSMLYPYTDNYLDDKSISIEEKKAFNAWFSLRLVNADCKAHTAYETIIDKLIKEIEGVFDRSQYPQVYESLLLIQQGQMKSLHQQANLRDLNGILTISIEKGGASVLADAYLIDGDITPEEYQFCIEYGLLLQIADDIQDIREDRMQQHNTLATLMDDKRARYNLTRQLLSYTTYVIQNLCPYKNHVFQDFVEKNCHLLIYFSLLKNKELYPFWFMRKVGLCMPVTNAFTSKLKQKFTFDINNHDVTMHRLDAYLALESN